MGNESFLDYETDMQTIRDYANAVAEIKTRIALAYGAALDQVQLVFQTASPSEATPDMMKIVLKSGVKTIEKIVIAKVKEATGADLGPLVELMHAIGDEVERASKAAANMAAAGWILDLRGKIVDAYTQGQTGEQLRQQIENEYNQHDEGGRGGYIAGIENELEALRQIHSVKDGTSLVPESNIIERAMYESWINQNFNGDCMDGTGLIQLQFEADGANSARVACLLGERIGARLNSVMPTTGVQNLMGLDVVKRVCLDGECMCFEGDNTVRKGVLDEEKTAFLSSPANWQAFTRFTS